MEREWSTKRIKSWLRRYQDWRGEVIALGYKPTTWQEGVQNGQVSDPTQRDALRAADLMERCREVESWLRSLSQSSLPEVIAAEHYMRSAAIWEIAEVIGIEWHQAKTLVDAIPLLILLRRYPEPLRSVSA